MEQLQVIFSVILRPQTHRNKMFVLFFYMFSSSAYLNFFSLVLLCRNNFFSNNKIAFIFTKIDNWNFAFIYVLWNNCKNVCMISICLIPHSPSYIDTLIFLCSLYWHISWYIYVALIWLYCTQAYIYIYIYIRI